MYPTYYLSVQNVDDDDVSLFSFASLGLVSAFLMVYEPHDFMLSDIVVNGMVNGFPPSDYEVWDAKKI